jgi:hypothetical protein
VVKVACGLPCGCSVRNRKTGWLPSSCTEASTAWGEREREREREGLDLGLLLPPGGLQPRVWVARRPPPPLVAAEESHVPSDPVQHTGPVPHGQPHPRALLWGENRIGYQSLQRTIDIRAARASWCWGLWPIGQASPMGQAPFISASSRCSQEERLQWKPLWPGRSSRHQ